MRLTGLAFFATFLAAAAAAQAQNTETLRIQRGEQLATIWCARCHLTGDPAQTSALVDAIPFATLGAMEGFDAGALAIALFAPHPAMPDFQISRADVQALADYIRAVAGPTGEAEERSEIDIGRAIAVSRCGECHAIAGDGPGRDPNAPAFVTFPQRWPVEALEEALAEGIVVSHEDVSMPEFELDPADIAALLAYIDSLHP